MTKTLKQIWNELERLENILYFTEFRTYIEAVLLPPQTPMFTLDSIDYMVEWNTSKEVYEMIYWLDTDDDNQDGRLMSDKQMEDLLTKLKTL